MSDKKCVIVFNEAREHTLSAGPGVSLRLIPGKNTCLLSEVEKVAEGNKSFQNMMDEGVIEVLDDVAIKTDAAGNIEVDITKVSVKEAKSIIEAEADLDVLAKYMNQETEAGDTEGRPGVVKAIDAQIEELVKAEEAAAEAKKKAEENQ